jgi:hypothetical protein
VCFSGTSIGMLASEALRPVLMTTIANDTMKLVSSVVNNSIKTGTEFEGSCICFGPPISNGRGPVLYKLDRYCVDACQSNARLFHSASCGFFGHLLGQSAGVGNGFVGDACVQGADGRRRTADLCLTPATTKFGCYVCRYAAADARLPPAFTMPRR